MIRKVSRKKLAIEKYTNCLMQSVNYRIYAEYWYLDTLVGENWDCLIYNDYEAIMPLPFVRKFGIKIITQPLYCQQLGVFHGEGFSKDIFHQFEKKLHRNLVRAYNFNEENTAMFSPKGKLKVNQVLDISPSYEDVYTNFNSNRKRNIKSFYKNGLIVKQNFDFDNLINFKIRNTPYKLNDETLLKLLNFLYKKELIESYSVSYDDDLIGFCIFIKSKNRLIYLNSCSNYLGKKNYVATGLINYRINKKSYDLENLLDFEGSNIPTINKYFESFGAKEKRYSSQINSFRWRF